MTGPNALPVPSVAGERPLWPPVLIETQDLARSPDAVSLALRQHSVTAQTVWPIELFLTNTQVDADLVVLLNPKPIEVPLVRTIVARHPWLCALLVGRQSAQPSQTGVQPRIWVVDDRLPDEALMPRLQEICLAASRLRLLHLARRALRHHPILIRQAVRAILSAVPMAEDLSGDSLITSISDVAERCGFSREALSRTQRITGVHLSTLIDWCRIGHAIQIRRTHGHPWDQVAWRCGYCSHTGLLSLARRTFGATLQDLDEISPWEPMETLLGVLVSRRKISQHVR